MTDAAAAALADTAPAPAPSGFDVEQFCLETGELPIPRDAASSVQRIRPLLDAPELVPTEVARDGEAVWSLCEGPMPPEELKMLASRGLSWRESDCGHFAIACDQDGAW